jgi:hypothetical protein
LVALAFERSKLLLYDMSASLAISRVISLASRGGNGAPLSSDRLIDL